MVPFRSKTSNLLVFMLVDNARAISAVLLWTPMTEEQLSAVEHKSIGNKLFSRKPLSI